VAAAAFMVAWDRQDSELGIGARSNTTICELQLATAGLDMTKG
jgi:hypothetical protein